MAPLFKKAEQKKQSTMIAKERLYLTLDGKRVVAAGPQASKLLASAGSNIQEHYIPLVQAYYAEKTKPKPRDLTQEDKEAPTTEATGPPGDPIENRETRIPKVLRKRGRPPKNA